jgi:pyruvate dehydrogenase E1 component alpha subunit
MADKRLRPGAVTACFFGEGAVGEGVFHETLNMAELWHLPVLFVCENNLYAMGVPLQDSEVETDIWRKARAYRMPAEQVDGMDPVQMEAAARRALAHIRDGGGPYFIEARTYRFRAHSMFDTQAYRTRNEIENWKHLDPIERLRAWMVANHEITDQEAQAIDAGVAAEIAAAEAFAQAGTLEPLEELERFVLMDSVVQEALP